jgi:hypothetical protein
MYFFCRTEKFPRLQFPVVSARTRRRSARSLICPFAPSTGGSNLSDLVTWIGILFGTYVGIVIAFETLVVTLGARQAARGWYRRVLQNPDVKVTRAGEPLRYVAVPVLGKERERVAGDYRLPWAVRFLTGFPPRSFLRLDRMPTT